MLGRFRGRLFLRQAEISRATVSSFLGGHKRYAELTRSDPLIIGVSRVQLMSFSISSKGT